MQSFFEKRRPVVLGFLGAPLVKSFQWSEGAIIVFLRIRVIIALAIVVDVIRNMNSTFLLPVS